MTAITSTAVSNAFDAVISDTLLECYIARMFSDTLLECFMTRTVSNSLTVHCTTPMKPQFVQSIIATAFLVEDVNFSVEIILSATVIICG